ncbi:hypothetical protein Sste5346_004655 [Sporothrix stenoceras]|uniref:WIBG Mago-binding domain-containing protein n=1 Tax=Sporothrix stenoceras TaxID=5173 RepID=A0ABR3Z7H7_9PEZI
MASQPTNAGIITDAAGVRHIPESTRADGSTRRAIKIRPGYQPPEDVALYKSRIAENYRNRLKNGTVPGAEVKEDKTAEPAPAAPVSRGSAGVPGAVPAGDAASESALAANKNAKRREARKKAAAAAAETHAMTTTTTASAAKTEAAPPVAVEGPQAEREKKARGLKKKLKQAKELKSKRDVGETLLPEQIAKVIRINELVRELDALGFDAEGESKT